MAYQDTLNQFRQAQSPNPNDFLKMLWPNLDPHQQGLFTQLLRRPVVSNTSQGQMSALGASVASVQPVQVPQVPKPVAPRGSVNPIIEVPKALTPTQVAAGAAGKTDSRGVSVDAFGRTSTERANNVGAIYKQYLGRDAGAEERAGYAGMSNLDIDAAVKGSQEAKNFSSKGATTGLPT